MPDIVTVRNREEYTTLDIPEKQFAMAVAGGAAPWEHYVALRRQVDAIWFISDPHGNVTREDLNLQHFTALPRGGLYPIGCLPCLAFDDVDDAFMVSIRGRAAAQASFFGVTAAAPGAGLGDGDIIWLYADSALVLFGEEVPAEVLGDSALVHFFGSSGMIVKRDADEEEYGEYIEKIAPGDLAKRRRSKLLGGGRDKRLLPAEASSSTAPVLYRSAFESFDDSWKPPFRVFGKSAMAMPEVALAVAGSGLEPVAFGDELVRTLGISATSGLALEVKNIVFSFWAHTCVDGCDPLHSTVMEHLARRLLQIQRAARKMRSRPVSWV